MNKSEIKTVRTYIAASERKQRVQARLLGMTDNGRAGRGGAKAQEQLVDADQKLETANTALQALLMAPPTGDNKGKGIGPSTNAAAPPAPASTKQPKLGRIRGGVRGKTKPTGAIASASTEGKPGGSRRAAA